MKNDRAFCLLILAGALVAVPALSGCGGANAASDERAAAERARSQVEQGPVRVTAEVQPVQPRLSDMPTLTLTIDSEEGVTVEKPQFGETIGRFKIRDLREPLPRTKDGRVIAQQVFTLEPTETGRLRIDPIPVWFADRRPQGDNAERSIETEPLSVEVTSVLGEKTPALGDFHGSAEPIALPGGVPGWAWALAAAVLAALAAVAWRKRRGSRKAIVPVKILSPEEIANAELDRLVASGLAASDIKQFYVELTGIVRRYIERTTGIRAPEQTTEEFLREVSRMKTFDQDLRARLRDFLESADLVKFAAHRPNTDDVDESVRRARFFLAAKETQP